MPSIQLVTLDPAIDATLHSDPRFFEAMGQEDWPRVAELILSLIGTKLTEQPQTIDTLHWGGYYVVDQQSQEFVGSCCYKGSPSDEGFSDSGLVEIAYFTYPSFEGRGYATAMAKKLIELAQSSEAVKRILAHTLPEKNASTRVLEKAGMRFIGEVVDPEDGVVWQWQAMANV